MYGICENNYGYICINGCRFLVFDCKKSDMNDLIIIFFYVLKCCNFWYIKMCVCFWLVNFIII